MKQMLIATESIQDKFGTLIVRIHDSWLQMGRATLGDYFFPLLMDTKSKDIDLVVMVAAPRCSISTRTFIEFARRINGKLKSVGLHVGIDLTEQRVLMQEDSDVRSATNAISEGCAAIIRMNPMFVFGLNMDSMSASRCVIRELARGCNPVFLHLDQHGSFGFDHINTGEWGRTLDLYDAAGAVGWYGCYGRPSYDQCTGWPVCTWLDLILAIDRKSYLYYPLHGRDLDKYFYGLMELLTEDNR